MLLTYGVILLTWLILLGSTTGLGMLLCRWRAPKADPRDLLQSGMWLGISLFFLISVLLSLVQPLDSVICGIALACFLIGGWIALISATHDWGKRGWHAFSCTWSVRRIPSCIVVALLILAVGVVTSFAAAEPMDADSGLYRVGAVTYAEKYGTVPGLANLHDRLGFNSSTSTAAGLLGNGVWTGQGFRLISGLIVVALLFSTIARILIPRRNGPTAGDWVSVMGTSFIIALVLTDSGRWIPSPSSDLVVAVLGVAATAFLVDALQGREVSLSASSAIALSGASASVRPLAWVTVTITIASVFLFRNSKRESRADCVRTTFSQLWLGLSMAAALLIAMLIRDAILTGWFFYPSAIVGLDVPWRTPPGTATAESITAYARSSTEEKTQVLSSSAWIRPWFSQFVSSREFQLNAYMTIGLFAAFCTPRGRRAWLAAMRILPWAVAPAVVTGVVWFITAPDVRFGWLFLTVIIVIPVALLFSYGAFPSLPLRLFGALLLCLLALSNVLNGRVFPRGASPMEWTLHLGAVQIPVQLGPHSPVRLTSTKLRDGSPAWFADNNACWDIVPACLLVDPQTVTRLGPSVRDGYAQVDVSGR